MFTALNSCQKTGQSTKEMFLGIMRCLQNDAVIMAAPKIGDDSDTPNKNWEVLQGLDQRLAKDRCNQ